MMIAIHKGYYILLWFFFFCYKNVIFARFLSKIWNKIKML